MPQRLINIKTEEYEHPFDRAALKAMRALPMFDSVVNFAIEWLAVKPRVVELCGNFFHVTAKSCPELFELVRDSAKVLEIDQLPEIYTQWCYGINAYTVGNKDNNILVMYTGTLDLLPDPEVRYIVSHELSHIKSRHVLYHVMASCITDILNEMGIVGKLAEPIRLALVHWSRMSEFTADRGGLLGCQDLNAALSATMKMAGLPKKYFNTSDPHVFAEQAKEFLSRYGDTAYTIIRTISILDDSHPWNVLRAAELIEWVESGEYDRILSRTAGKTCPGCGNQVDSSLKSCPICGCHF